VFVDLVSRMLDYDPETRIKPDEALRHPFIEQLVDAEGGGGGGGSSRRSHSAPSGKKGHK